MDSSHQELSFDVCCGVYDHFEKPTFVGILTLPVFLADHKVPAVHAKLGDIQKGGAMSRYPSVAEQQGDYMLCCYLCQFETRGHTFARHVSGKRYKKTRIFAPVFN